MLSDRKVTTKALAQGVSLPLSLSRGSSSLSVALISEHVRFSLRVGKKNVAKLSAAIGAKLPAGIGQTTIIDGLKILCLGPDEWLLICEPEKSIDLREHFSRAAAKILFSLVDISHRNVGLVLSGAATPEVLNAGCPLDLALKSFPVGCCTRTVFEHAEIVILREDEHQFHVETWRSFGPYLAAYFERVANGL